MIILDKGCQPHPILFFSPRGSSKKFLSKLGAATKEFLSRHVVFYRIVRNALRYQKSKRRAERNAARATSKQASAPSIPQPDELYQKMVVEKKPFGNSDAGAFFDTGAMRVRCSGYFDGQIRFILQQMVEIPGINAVDVVSFPHTYNKQSHARSMFEGFVNEGVINSYIDTPSSMKREGHKPADFVCHRGDDHLCEQGNRWIAEKILQRLLPELQKAATQGDS